MDRANDRSGGYAGDRNDADNQGAGGPLRYCTCTGKDHRHAKGPRNRVRWNPPPSSAHLTAQHTPLENGQYRTEDQPQEEGKTYHRRA
jgi:hypothetical protein